MLDIVVKTLIQNGHQITVFNNLSSGLKLNHWELDLKRFQIILQKEKAKLPEIDLSLGSVTARCFASDVYLELMKKHSLGEEKKLSREEIGVIKRVGSYRSGCWEIMEDK